MAIHLWAKIILRIIVEIHICNMYTINERVDQ